MNKIMTSTVDQSFIHQVMVVLMKLCGKRITVSIGPEKKIGTDKQRKYYWSVIVSILSMLMGASKEEAHEALCAKLLRIDRPDLPRDCIVIKRYSQLSTVEREQYHEECRRLIAEWFPGSFIPIPNEASYE